MSAGNARKAPIADDTIFDVGMSHGEDTEYYLHKGFRVVAFEANPTLVSLNTKRFAGAISAGRLTIVPVGIAAETGVFDFYVNDENGRHSSFVREVGAPGGAVHHVVKVKCSPFRELLRRHGTPYYLKIDIEGHNLLCLLDLDPSNLPAYLSVGANQLEYLAVLWSAGYRQFKMVDRLSQVFHRSWRIWQTASNAAEYEFKAGSSGPFAEDTAGDWLTFEVVAYNWLHRKTGDKNLDFHAKLG